MDKSPVELWIGKIQCLCTEAVMGEKQYTPTDLRSVSCTCDKYNQKKKFHEEKTDLAILSGGFASWFQALDMTIDMSFKMYMKKQY